MEEEPKKIYGYFFKAFGTGVVLVIALSLVGWIAKTDIWTLVLVLGVLSGIALVIGIILSIWNA